jgi:hypothetical protein
VSEQSTARQTRSRRAPRGVLLIAILLIVVAFFSAGIGTLVRTEALREENLTRPLLLSFAAVTSILAYGLIRVRRWAWAATLSFVIVQAYFLLLGTLLEGSSQYAGFAILIAIAAYMLLPGVRNVFLRRDG